MRDLVADRLTRACQAAGVRNSRGSFAREMSKTCSVELPEVVPCYPEPDSKNQGANGGARGVARHLASDVAAHDRAARHGQAISPIDLILYDEDGDRQSMKAARQCVLEGDGLA